MENLCLKIANNDQTNTDDVITCESLCGSSWFSCRFGWLICYRCSLYVISPTGFRMRVWWRHPIWKLVTYIYRRT